MGVDLQLIKQNENDSHFNWSFWRELLDLAHTHGWKPEEKVDHYFHNDGQLVTESDAQELGKALSQALNVEFFEHHKEAYITSFILASEKGFFIH